MEQILWGEMSDFDVAISLACKVHAGQVDKSGQPYILHPLRLLLKFRCENERIVSVLHDVIEDGDITLDELRTLGFSDLVIGEIDCLSRRKGEDYQDFICRLSSNDLAKKVKIEDIKDNLDVTRLETIGEDDLNRVAKYHKALQYLVRR